MAVFQNFDIIYMIVEKTNTGFSAFSEEFPIFTTGKTIPELIHNAYEAVQLFFDDQKSEENCRK